MRTLLLGSLLTLSIASAQAAEPAAPVRSEIEGLLTMLGTSQCQFYRNGSWHDGHAAESHLRMKYEYLSQRGTLASAEEFIDDAATKSSLSGETYAVKCGSDPEQPSATWLKSKLQQWRAAPSTKS
jgi:hypothetical protein